MLTFGKDSKVWRLHTGGFPNADDDVHSQHRDARHRSVYLLQFEPIPYIHTSYLSNSKRYDLRRKDALRGTNYARTTKDAQSSEAVDLVMLFRITGQRHVFKLCEDNVIQHTALIQAESINCERDPQRYVKRRPKNDPTKRAR